MDKRILLIGNDDGLPGVKVDLKNFKEYFKSDKGGSWYEHEIIEKLNPTKDSLIAELEQLKKSNLDFLIIIFSGHGGQKRDTVLELNADGELFSESRFHGICSKQLQIFDCCRSYLESVSESIELRAFNKAYSSTNSRAVYENRIRQAAPQEVRLYACAIGEVANDTSAGGAYVKNLLSAARYDSDQYILVGRTHVIAAQKTTEEFPKQHPDSVLPRLITSQQLIFGVN